MSIFLSFFLSPLPSLLSLFPPPLSAHTNLVLLVDLGRHVARDKPGSHAIRGNSSTGKLARDSLGHGDDSSLRRGVVGLSGVAREADDRGDVDDASRLLLGHDFGRGLGGEEDACFLFFCFFSILFFPFLVSSSSPSFSIPLSLSLRADRSTRWRLESPRLWVLS